MTAPSTVQRLVHGGGTGRSLAGSFLLALAIALQGGGIAAQNPPEQLDLNLFLGAPAPGFVLLGIEPASVERPGSVSDVAASVLSATDNLNVLPHNYALSVAPYWLASHPKLTYDDYVSNNDVGTNAARTFTISIAATDNAATTNDTSATSLGIGMRLSLLRGRSDTTLDSLVEARKIVVEKLRAINDFVHTTFLDLRGKDPDWNRLKARSDSIEALRISTEQKGTLLALIADSIQVREQALHDNAVQLGDQEKAAEVDELRGASLLVQALRERRQGWKLDFASGLVLDFPDRVFGHGQLSRLGAWFTGGFEGSNASALGVVRYMGNHADPALAALDLGGRVIVDHVRDLSLSLEGVYRAFPKRGGPNDQWRTALALDYAIAKNRVINFTFGRDYEGKQSGNLIAVVNFLLGFGTQRPVTPK
jgi:hypothetical protein